MRDLLFPTDNAWGVPVLDLDKQADAAELPFRPWGSVSRTTRNPGTLHFFVDDYRFSALDRNPDRVVNCAPVAVVEPNYSVYDVTPPALALYATYRKRWMARYWQALGVPVYVDLNVPPNHQETNLLGVPHGWNAYATRGYDAEPGWLESQLTAARDRSGRHAPLFVVVGGGARTAELCRRFRLVHIPYAAKKNAYSEAG